MGTTRDDTPRIIMLMKPTRRIVKGITRLQKRSAEGGETEPEGAALALKREVRR
jgi:hypothetical protein